MWPRGQRATSHLSAETDANGPSACTTRRERSSIRPAAARYSRRRRGLEPVRDPAQRAVRPVVAGVTVGDRDMSGAGGTYHSADLPILSTQDGSQLHWGSAIVRYPAEGGPPQTLRRGVGNDFQSGSAILHTTMRSSRAATSPSRLAQIATAASAFGCGADAGSVGGARLVETVEASPLRPTRRH